jgi:uncharacterized protein (DUF58 family)
LYLTRRFFLILGSITAVFVLGYPFPLLFPVALTLLALALALVLTDVFLLYGAGQHRVECVRDTAPVWSLSDPNEITLTLQNQGRYPLHASVIDELPEQLQRRDFLETCLLQPGLPVRLRYEATPLTRGLYRFHSIRVFISTRLALIERRLTFGKMQEVRVYPSILQMRRYELRALRQVAHDTGIKKMRRIGHSYEFEQVKYYVQGDDYRTINWKASC